MSFNAEGKVTEEQFKSIAIEVLKESPTLYGAFQLAPREFVAEAMNSIAPAPLSREIASRPPEIGLDFAANVIEVGTFLAAVYATIREPRQDKEKVALEWFQKLTEAGVEAEQAKRVALAIAKHVGPLR